MYAMQNIVNMSYFNKKLFTVINLFNELMSKKNLTFLTTIVLYSKYHLCKSKINRRIISFHYKF